MSLFYITRLNVQLQGSNTQENIFEPFLFKKINPHINLASVTGQYFEKIVLKPYLHESIFSKGDKTV